MPWSAAVFRGTQQASTCPPRCVLRRKKTTDSPTTAAIATAITHGLPTTEPTAPRTPAAPAPINNGAPQQTTGRSRIPMVPNTVVPPPRFEPVIIAVPSQARDYGPTTRSSSGVRTALANSLILALEENVKLIFQAQPRRPSQVPQLVRRRFRLRAVRTDIGGRSPGRAHLGVVRFGICPRIRAFQQKRRPVFGRSRAPVDGFRPAV